MPELDLLLELLFWFGFLMSAAFGNPTPEELIVIAGGIRTSHLEQFGHWRWLMLPTCIAGALVADFLLYALGRWLGGYLQRKGLLARLAPPEKQQHILDNFHRYGALIFVIGRLVPGIRTALFLSAGTMRLPFVRFVIADGVGALFGVSLFFLLGYGLGTQFEQQIRRVNEEIAPYKRVLLVALVLVAAYIVYRMFRNPTPTGDPVEVPLIGKQIEKHMPSSVILRPAEREAPKAAEGDPSRGQTG